VALPDHPNRTVRDAKHTERLDGPIVRAEGDEAVRDPAADEAYDGLGATWTLFSAVFGRNSIDDRGMPLEGIVHYGVDYDNAFWDGYRMVFGDGDGTIFNRFTVAVDVIGHELTHGVTDDEAALAYMGQSGALNESMSDVFGALVKQHHLGQSAAQADWLIGAGLLRPSVKGVALRSMKAPGTAYDDPVLGKDPQPGHMDDFVTTTADNGGVHINSGIPNRAFYEAATALGGQAWERAGRIWYDALRAPLVGRNTNFSAFAQATVRSAGVRFGAGSEEAQAVTEAWKQVGVRA
jgi:Zn-dependent metalloprotease